MNAGRPGRPGGGSIIRSGGRPRPPPLALTLTAQPSPQRHRWHPHVRDQVVVGLVTMAATPLYERVASKEYLPVLALLLAAAGTMQLTLTYTISGLYVAAALLGGAFGVTNAYGTSALWEYFYGGSESQRLKHVSAAITTAASGVAIWLYGAAWARHRSYHGALSGSALLALSLCLADALALAKPEVRDGVPASSPELHSSMNHT